MTRGRANHASDRRLMRTEVLGRRSRRSCFNPFARVTSKRFRVVVVVVVVVVGNSVAARRFERAKTMLYSRFKFPRTKAENLYFA